MNADNPKVFQRLAFTPQMDRYIKKKRVTSIIVVPGRNSCCAFRCAKAQVKINRALKVDSDGSIKEIPPLQQSQEESSEDLQNLFSLYLDNVTVYIHPALKTQEDQLTIGIDKFLFAAAFWAEGFTLKRRCPKTGS